MDILNIVQYERTFPVELVHPVSREPIGVTFHVTHIDAAAPTKVAAEQDADAAMGLRRPAAAQVKVWAACISDWEWGEYEFGEGKGAPDLSLKSAVDLLEKAPWILPQITEVVHKMANFTDN